MSYLRLVAHLIILYYYIILSQLNLTSFSYVYVFD